MSWNAVWSNLKYAARGLRRRPAFTAAVVTTLGLGIGANATMFGIVDRLLFRPPDFLRAPDRVHRVYLGETLERGEVAASSPMSYKRYLELAAWATTLERTAAFHDREMALGVGDDAREVRVEGVSASLFGFFDVQPVAGRFFTPDEDVAPEGTAVAVLGYGHWLASHGGATDVVGKAVTIGSKRYTIVGVAPKGFRGMARAEPAAFIPITSMASDLFRDVGSSPRPNAPTYYGSHDIVWMEMLVRRRPGTRVESAASDLTNAYHRSYLAEQGAAPGMRSPELARPRALVAPVQRERGPNRGSDTRVATWLAGVAGVVLLVACFNVGNLLLARAFGRRREISIRVALGVGRAQLLRQLAVECLLLATLGAVAGLAVAQWGGGLLRTLLLGEADRTATFLDPRLLAFTAAATLLVALVTGLAPALFAGRADIAATLRAGARAATAHRSRTRAALLVMQVALSVLLLVGAGLFVRSLVKVRTLDLGYDPDRVAYVALEMRGVVLEGEARNTLRRQLLERAAALPVVEAASRTISVPFRLNLSFPISVPGIDSASRLGDFYFHAVTPGYFATMGTRIVRGRGIAATDTRDAPRVIVVSESMARTLWPGRDALGQCVKLGADTVPCSEVVGVAQDIRRGSLTDEKGLQYYVAIDRMRAGGGGLLVRTRGEATAHAEALRRALQRGMPGASYVTVTPLADILAPVTRSWTLGATMFGVFGGLALVLAALGLYSVIAFGVAQRGQELAVRSALGARTADVVRLVLGEGIRLATAGVAIGVGLALAAARWIGPLLFDTSPTDPAILGGVIATLLGTALLASAVPAWRAARVDPNLALRSN